MKLETLSGYELGKLVNNKQISPVEVMNYFIDLIDKENPKLNAFTYTKPEYARRVAKEYEYRILQGEYLGPFAGVPTAFKDFLNSKKGWSNSHGGVRSMCATDTADSMFCKAAEGLGAIAVGKTNAPPFGFSGSCENSMYGRTCNPYDLNRTSGGSSGGSASAVGGHLIPFAEGGDAGGSIRIPAAWCNCFGFKAGIGTVPSYCRPDGWAATHPYCFNGAITRTVLDSALLLNNMAQYDPRDPLSLPIAANKDFTELMKADIKGKKVALTYDFNLFNVDECVKTAVDQTAANLVAAGAIVEPVNFNFKHTLEEIAECWCWSISVDCVFDVINLKMKSGINLFKDNLDETTPEFRKYVAEAGKKDVFSLKLFNHTRTDILDAFETVFENYDLILSPVACCEPLLHTDLGPDSTKIIGGKPLSKAIDFIAFAETFLVNFVGYPAAAVPAPLTENHLPVGAQLIGKKYREEDVLAASYALESIQPWN